MATVESNTNLDSSLRENRVFPAPAEFAAKAHIKSLAEYEAMYRRSVDQPEEFWAEAAGELDWFAPWTKVISGEAQHTKWFIDGKLNLSHNCVDRHALGDRRNKVALLWEGEPGESPQTHLRRTLRAGPAFRERPQRPRHQTWRPCRCLHGHVSRTRNRTAGLRPYRRGAFSDLRRLRRSRNLRPRQRFKLRRRHHAGHQLSSRGSEVHLKDIVDEALIKCSTVKNVIVFRRSGSPIDMHPGRDLWWHEAMEKAAPECPPEWMDAEDPLYLLYTSGTTGKPKGLLHTTGGYSVQTYLTSKYVFDLRNDDVYWCTADIGWVTGHSYVVYGPLQNGATVMMYEGAPNWPENDRFWKIIDDHKVTVFYTAPTAIRAFTKWGDSWVLKHSLASLRLLGTVGEPINPESWMWYHPHDRQRALPHRRHLLADRNRGDHDLPYPRSRRNKTGLSHKTLLRNCA